VRFVEQSGVLFGIQYRHLAAGNRHGRGGVISILRLHIKVAERTYWKIALVG
jgi:hypothetical protein